MPGAKPSAKLQRATVRDAVPALMVRSAERNVHKVRRA
jgi:hypothetical protein